jgi:hypothetical protein
MKKLLYLSQLAIVAVLFSSTAIADGYGGWGGHGYGHRDWGHHGGHHGHHGWGHHGHHGGYGQQVNNYYPQPQQNYYYQQPQQYYQQPQQYYPPQPQYQGGYDNRSHQGLAGGVVGTVFGYELGNGHPLAAGLGAAAGSFLGNGMGWRY